MKAGTMKRLIFSSVKVLLLACAVSTASAQESVKSYDILLKGGHVIDPANNINTRMDVAVADGKIASVEKNIPAAEAKKTVDVSGYFVTPGLIDMHIVCFYTSFEVTSSVIADHHCLPSGVTTC